MSVLDELYRRFEIALDNGDEETANNLAFAIKERESSPAPVEEEESGVIENILTGFGASAVGIVESAALGAATALEEESEVKAREYIQDVFGAITPEGGDKDAFSYKLAAGFGSYVAPIAAAVGIGALGVPAGVGALTAGVLGVGATVGETSERARTAGATEEERNKAITGWKTFVAGAIEALPLGRFVKSANIPQITKLMDSIGPEVVETIGQRAHSAFISGGYEASQEAVTGILMNLTEQEYNAAAETFGGVGEEATIGGIVGATLDLLMPGGSRARAAKGAEEAKALIAGQERLAQSKKQQEKGDLFPDTGPTPKKVTDEELADAMAMEDAEQERLARLEDDDQIKSQPDMIDRAEEAQIQDMEDTDEIEALIKEDEDTAEIEALINEDNQKLDVEETAQAQAMVDEDERQEKAKVEERQRLQQESDLAETGGRRERRQQVESEEGRRAVLLDVVEKNPTNNYNTLQSKYEKALADEGYTDTTTKDSERGTIERAVNVQRTQEKAIPADSDLAPLESQIRERGAPRQPAPKTSAKKQGLKRQELPELPAAAQEALKARGVKIPKPEVQPAPVVEEAKVQPAPKKVQPAPKTKVAPQPVATTTPTKPIPGMSTVDPETGKLVVDTPIKLADTDRTALAPVSDVAQYVDEKGKDKDFRKKRPAESVPRYEDAKDKFDDNRVIAKYFNAYANPESALRAAAFEVANDMPAARNVKGDVDPIEVKRRGTGGKSAKAVVEWAKNNLPAETNATINKQIETDKAEDAKAVENTKKKLREEVAAAELTEANAKQKKKQAKMELEGGKALAAKERVARRKRKEAAAQRAKKQAETKDAKDVKKAEKVVKKQPTAEQKEADKQQKANEAEIKKLVAAEKKRLESAGIKFDPVAVEGIIANSVNNDSKTSYEAQQKAGERETATQFFARVGKASLFDRFVSKKDAAALSEPLPIGAIRAINDGDLVAALNAIATSTKSSRVKNIASAMARKVGSTKVAWLTAERFDSLFAEKENESVAGVYLHSGSNMPASFRDTIFINSESNTGVHTLLHEMSHALTIYEINMDPDTGKVLGTTANAKRIGKIWEDFQKVTKDRGLDAETYYGLTNVNEFVAEAYTSSEFRQLLNRVHPDGKFADSKSLWERFSTTVINMVRRLMGLEPSPTLLTEVDNVISSMLTPADQGVIQFSEFDGTRAGAARLLEDLGDIQKKFKNLTGSKESFIDNAVGVLGDVPADGQKFLLNLMGSQSVGDVARNLGFGNLGIKLHKMFNLRRGAMDKADEEMRVVTEKLSKFAAADEKNQPQLDKVIYDPVIGATITQLDPTLTEAEATKRYKNSDDLATWKKQQVEWKKLGKEGQDMYVELRDAYKNQFLKLKDSIFRRLDSAVSDESMSKDAANTLKQQVLEQMFSNTTLDVYFPLTREGDFVLSYAFDNPKNPEQAYVVRRFTTKREMERVKAELEKDSKVVTDSIETKRDVGKATMYDNAPPATFAGKTLKLLKDGNASKELQDAFMTMYMDHLPETSFAQSLRKRTGVLGFEGNSKTAIRTKGFDLARQVVQIEYGGRISAIRSEINAVQPPKGGDDKRFEVVQAHMDETANFAINGANRKGMEKYVKNANQLAFVYTIGFNVSSAIVNLSQIPLVVLPYLSSRHGFMASSAAIIRAGQVVGGTSDRYGGTGIDDLFDLDANGNYTAKDSLSDGQKKMIKDMKLGVLIKAAAAQGQLTKAFLPDALAVHEQGRASRGGIMGSTLDVISTAGAHFGFAQAERFNRQTAMVATYDLSLRQLRAKKEAGETYYASTEANFVDLSTMSDSDITTLAAEEAIYQVQETNGGAVLETSPKWAQQGIGRIAFMYKTYGLQMYYTMFKSAKLFTDNVGDNTPEGIELRRQAKKQIAGVYLSSLLMAGVQGVPLYGAARTIADMVLFDDEEDDADTVVRKYIGEGFYKGFAVNALGVDFATRIKLSDLVIQTNRYNNDPSTEEIIGYHLGGPALSIGNRLIRGVEDLRNGEIERGIENLVPAAAANVYKSTFGRFARDEGIYTRRGDPIYDDMSFKDLAFQTMGFAPAEYTFAQEQASMSKRIEGGILAKRQKLLRNLNIARRFGDVEKAKEIRVEIREFNKDHRGQRINGETIRRSASSFGRTTATMYNGVTITKSLRADAARSRDEYQQGFEVLFGKDE